MNPQTPKIAHRVVFSGLADSPDGGVIELDGPEAYHASTVKRCRVGETIGILDGRGRRSIGVITHIQGHKTRPVISLQIEPPRVENRIAGTVEIWTALPKGDRLEGMIDQLSQLGVCAWRPMRCERSERRWESVKTDKLARVANESMKQCDRAWVLEIGAPISFDDAIAIEGALVADGSGACATDPMPVGTKTIVLVGPEGGWSDRERDLITRSGAGCVCLGFHVLRLETAACAAGAIMMNRISAGANP